MSFPIADAVRHAGDRHERLAEERHLPALHQEQQADPVVLAGASWALCLPCWAGGKVLVRDSYQLPKRHEAYLDPRVKDLPSLTHSSPPNLEK